MRLLLRSHLRNKLRWQQANQAGCPANAVPSVSSIAGAKSFFQSASALSGLPKLSDFIGGHRRYSSQATKSTTTEDPLGESIYSGKYTSRIVRVKIFSLATSAMGLYAQPILWQQGQVVGGTSLGVLMCSIAGIFTFVTPALLHFVTKKYVVDIRYNKETDEYTTITVSFFLFKIKTTFKIEDIEIPEIETMFTSIKVGPKKIPLFVDAASFTDTHHYARFMGYDKPLEFELKPDASGATVAEANADSTMSKQKDKQN